MITFIFFETIQVSTRIALTRSAWIRIYLTVFAVFKPTEVSIRYLGMFINPTLTTKSKRPNSFGCITSSTGLHFRRWTLDTQVTSLIHLIMTLSVLTQIHDLFNFNFAVHFVLLLHTHYTIFLWEPNPFWTSWGYKSIRRIYSFTCPFCPSLPSMQRKQLEQRQWSE